MGQILHHVTVVRDGMHNAFTSLAYWHDAFWIAYRKANRHGISYTGHICLSVSADGTRFREVARVKVPGDNRDPRLLVIDEDRMALFFPSRLCSSDPWKHNAHQQFVTFSSDGFNWDTPLPILELRHHLFRVRRHGNTYYGLDCFREGGMRKLFVLVSNDLTTWKQLCQVGTDRDLLNESDVIFSDSGDAWMVSRSKRASDHSFFCYARPPYTDWELVDLKTRIHAPAIIAHNGMLYVAGRNSPQMEGDHTWPFGSSIGVWKLSMGTVQPVLRIPATGDCSYTGFIVGPENRVFISYYSQHAYHLGVVPPFDATPVELGRDQARKGAGSMAADVYFAELELP